MAHPKKTPPPVLSQAHPSFLAAAVLFVNDGDGQRVKKDFGGTIEADPMSAQVLPGLGRVPFVAHMFSVCTLSVRVKAS